MGRAAQQSVLTRTVSAVLLGLPVILVVYWGSPLFELMVAVAAAVLAWEWFRMCGAGQPRGIGLALGGVLLAAVAAMSVAGIGFAVAMLLAGALAVLAIDRREPWLAAGTLYLGLPCVALIWLRFDPAAGRAVVLWLMGVVWASDIGGYVAGRLIGGPRLAPRISPGKTWAGLFGAAAAAAMVSVAFSLSSAHAPVWIAAGCGLLLGLVAQAGDLGESWVKRRFGVKDVSALIPGHGGLLDRVDALMAAILIVAAMTAADEGVFSQWL